MQGASSLAGGVSQSQALKAQGDFSQYQAEQNARLAEAQAEDATKRGAKEASRLQRQTRGVIGAQRAALAAQGIDISSGTAADIQAETAQFGIDDASTIRQNAIREAYGFQREAINTRAQGQFDRISARSQASSTLLTGGLSAIGHGVSGFNFTPKDKPGGKSAKSS